MIFSVTERGTFRRCQRKAVLSSKNGQHLTPIFAPLRLATGSIVHHAHQKWLEAPDTPMYDHAMIASLEAVKKATDNYTRQVGTTPNDAELLSTHEAIGFAVAMCENYQKKWHTPLPPDYTLIAAEQKIRVPVPGTRHSCNTCRGQGWVCLAIDVQQFVPVGYDAPGAQACPDCDPLHRGTQVHYLEGRLDGLVRHVSGRIDVLEHKTYGNRPKRVDLETNDQFLAYLWMVRQLNVTTSPVILYDGSWRRTEPPRGKTFDDLFARYIITRTEHELAEFARLLPIELNAMAQLYEKPENALINRQWNGCWDCPFDGSPGLCRAMSRGETETVQMLLKTAFTERTDDVDTTDTDNETNNE